MLSVVLAYNALAYRDIVLLQELVEVGSALLVVGGEIHKVLAHVAAVVHKVVYLGYLRLHVV